MEQTILLKANTAHVGEGGGVLFFPFFCVKVFRGRFDKLLPICAVCVCVCVCVFVLLFVCVFVFVCVIVCVCVCVACECVCGVFVCM